jgi:shikimate dehydrogenase
VAFALAEAGAATVTISDLVPERAAALVQRLNQYWPGRAAAGTPDPASVGIAVNVTPMGLRPEDPLSFDPIRLATATVVADVIMKPATTRLLETAERHGCRIHRGHHMLDEQVGLYADYFGLSR